ncbi:MAG: DICT sensory domain-containing protein, partial [Cyanobacteria bacterium J06649_11]
MNLSPPQSLSFYQLTLDVPLPPKRLILNSATLLSMVKSQIDLLVEQKISATIVAKFPPLHIFESELKRFQQNLADSTIYNCQLAEVGEVQTNVSSDASESVNSFSTTSSYLSQNLVQLVTDNPQIKREYFFIVLSEEFCSLIL